MEVNAQRHPILDVFLWMIVVVMAFIVVYTSLMPPSGQAPTMSDKVFHYLAYAGLAMSLLLAAVWAPVRGEGRFPTSPLAVTVVAFMLGLALEVIQAPLEERDAEIWDAIANGAGAMSALIAWMFLRIAVESPPQPR